MWFDRDKCTDGLQALRHYRYDVDNNGQFLRNPLHDDASHGADALRACAVAMQEARRAQYSSTSLALRVPPGRRSPHRWMAM
jgi:hypothetical protein